MLALKAIAVWLLILVCAVANGVFREKFLLPTFGVVAAFVISGLLLSLCIVVVSAALIPWFGRLTMSSYFLLGASWLALTLMFEFGFGRFVQHKSWAQLFEAYAFQDGNLWPLVLIVVTVAPLLAARLRGSLPGVAD